MKKYTLLLITLVMSGPAFAATLGQHAPIGVVTLQCDPGSCASEARSGHWLSQVPYGYERQVQRVMRQADEVGSLGGGGFSSRIR
ncbi:hypothetical protein NG99_05065 [Erwinia typographi]|uniref:Secreted protein n=1 Tax=Erwinia typographi TaxID=371042 RepID=A0A0A3Z864_9GAMM|nr:hypothetical protein [Erwinia typographi]KGT95015.1 hypothetical protein NG99_05065 [Erwinia typographi]